jgi:uncharacterized membrane protein YccF (DUF307 family)
MRTLANVLWHFPFFGFITALCNWLLGFLLTLTVVAAPIGLGLMQYGKFLMWPFASNMVSKSAMDIKQNPIWKTYSFIITILYFPIGAILLVTTLFQIIGLCITIVGIPMAVILAKSLSTYLNPVHKICVSRGVKQEIDRNQAAKKF